MTITEKVTREEKSLKLLREIKLEALLKEINLKLAILLERHLIVTASLGQFKLKFDLASKIYKELLQFSNLSCIVTKLFYNPNTLFNRELTYDEFILIIGDLEEFNIAIDNLIIAKGDI